MITKRIVLTVCALMMLCTLSAQQVLTLDDCHRMALENNSKLRQADTKREETHNLERAAMCEMLPKVSAVGGYVWNDRSVDLVGDEQRERLTHIGDALEADISEALHNKLDDVPLVGGLLANRLDDVLACSGIGSQLDNVGSEIVDALRTDTRNMGGVAVTLNQPIYMGGKLVALHRTASLAEHMADVEYTKEERATLLSVDEAYWQVVSVEQRALLAESYAALLDTLERNVELAVEAGVATTGDLAKVRVKHNEARMNLTKATGGLALAKMLLAERCGMPLDSEYTLVATETDTLQPLAQSDLDDIYARRPEMQMLHIGDSIAREGVRIAASSLKPNVMATAGYFATNPNVFNGFSNSWGGTWMAGVVAQVPLFNPAGVHAVKAAKAKRHETALKMQEAQDLIALQVSKTHHEYTLALRRMSQAESNLTMAEENLLLADESYNEGVCSSSDLMAAQTAWMQAKSELLDARIEVEMTRLYHKQALGE